MLLLILAGLATLTAAQLAAPGDSAWLQDDIRLMNIVPPFFPRGKSRELPVSVAPFPEHIRARLTDIETDAATGIRIDDTGKIEIVRDKKPSWKDGPPVNASACQGAVTWHATDNGLFRQDNPNTPPVLHASYGVEGPLATRVTAVATDSKQTLWIGTPIGLTMRTADGSWIHIRGKDGLPCEDVTALDIDKKDNVWIGTSHGAILYRPYEDGRKWFYRAGRRYLPGDNVKAIAVAPDGTAVYFLTDAGIGRIDIVTTTLLQKAQTIENRVNERHRRLGLVSDCMLDDDENPTSHIIGDNDNDGLWTAYHVAAMSLCYGVTKDEAAKRSARDGMHALYMLQNASGTPGLVARSVLPPEIGEKKGPRWRPTPDGKMYWKSDTSSDEIDGHYLAFYAYYEHIARFDDAERGPLEKQLITLTDYIVDHGYQLIDWDGKRTQWGFWDPKSLNENPLEYVENGLNSLQILSFLKVAHYITGDKKYQEHYRKLIVEHGYLNNILLTKKGFPDTNNHSDDQLGFVAWYPILQLEKDPKVRRALIAGVRHHYEIVRPEQPSLYTFIYATVDPAGADIEGAIENLRQIPTDRRCWATTNSTRDDVLFSPHKNRFGKEVLTRVLPADERVFRKWNADPYLPDDIGDGRHEDDGTAYLLPYWMGRCHGFIAEAQK